MYKTFCMPLSAMYHKYLMETLQVGSGAQSVKFNCADNYLISWAVTRSYSYSKDH